MATSLSGFPGMTPFTTPFTTLAVLRFTNITDSISITQLLMVKGLTAECLLSGILLICKNALTCQTLPHQEECFPAQ